MSMNTSDSRLSISAIIDSPSDSQPLSGRKESALELENVQRDQLPSNHLILRAPVLSSAALGTEDLSDSAYSRSTKCASANQTISSTSFGQEEPQFTSSKPGVPGTIERAPKKVTLTLVGQQGPVQLPVDVESASQAMNEKRKRNAQASARFRARRKQNEHGAALTIQQLQQQLCEMTNKADSLRRQRDELANILDQILGRKEYVPRPPSPRPRTQE